MHPYAIEIHRESFDVHLRSQGGEVKKDITDEECQGGCVQATEISEIRMFLLCSCRAFHFINILNGYHLTS